MIPFSRCLPALQLPSLNKETLTVRPAWPFCPTACGPQGAPVDPGIFLLWSFWEASISPCQQLLCAAATQSIQHDLVLPRVGYSFMHPAFCHPCTQGTSNWLSVNNTENDTPCAYLFLLLPVHFHIKEVGLSVFNTAEPRLEWQHILLS